VRIFFSEVIWILADFLTNLLIKKSFSQIKFFETNEMTFLHLYSLTGGLKNVHFFFFFHFGVAEFN